MSVDALAFVRAGTAPLRGRQRSNSFDEMSKLSILHPDFPLGATSWTLAGLTARLLWFVGLPGIWLIQVVRMLLFVTILLPAFIPLAVRHFTSPALRHNIPYGDRSRHMLDVYLPCRRGKLYPPPDARGQPVVVFVTGGAWIIGYKLWAFIMGKTLSENGVLCVVPDYRNFPEACVGDMVSDVDLALAFVAANIEDLGGDPNNITLIGQSAGAHLSILSLLRACISSATEHVAAGKDNCRGGAGRSSPLVNIRRWVGISGPYDLVKLSPIMHRRGLHRRVVKALASHDLASHSPTRLCLSLAEAQASRDAARAACATQAVANLVRQRSKHSIAACARTPAPPVIRLRTMLTASCHRPQPPLFIFHGLSDATVPPAFSKELAVALRALRLGDGSCPHVRERYYAGKSHTDPILEDPIGGGKDVLITDILSLIRIGEIAPSGDSGESGDATFLPQLLPAVLLKFARWFNPF